MNRNAVVSNGTVFGAWALGRSIAVVGALLVITFVVIEPEASWGLGVAARTVFWVIHVGLGLVALYVASWLVLPHMMNSLPAWLVLLVAGTGGALLVAPVSYLVEQALPASLSALKDEDEWLYVFASRGWWQAIAAEFLQLAPATLGFWMIINLPFFAHRGSFSDARDPNVTGSAEPVDLDKTEAGRYAESARAEFISRLPESLGTNVTTLFRPSLSARLHGPRALHDSRFSAAGRRFHGGSRLARPSSPLGGATRHRENRQERPSMVLPAIQRPEDTD